MGEGEHAVKAFGDAHRRGNQVPLNVAKVRVPLSAVLFAWAGRRLSAGAVWVARNPGVVAAAVVALLAWRVTLADGPVPVLTAVTVLVVVLFGWRQLHRGSFTRLVIWGARGRWRAATVYRYRWQPAMVTTGLAMRADGTEYLPRLVCVRSTGSIDVVRVRMLPGQTLTDWAGNAPRLAQTFGAIDCRVRSVPRRVHDLVLWFLTEDPLTEPVQPFDPQDPPDLAALPVALGEDGLVHRIRLLGAHLLVLGATGSGKGSVIWSLITALAPGIRDGLSRSGRSTPKAAWSSPPAGALFTRFVYGDPDDGTLYELDFAHILEGAVYVMRRRQATLRGHTRLPTPTKAEPLVVVVIDELASLTAYVVDRDAKRRITAALSLLLSRGRAVGVSVVGAVQDPRKDVVSMRDLFPTRILLRVTEPEHVALTLGPGARDRGARADLIDETTPGVANGTFAVFAKPDLWRGVQVDQATVARQRARRLGERTPTAVRRLAGSHRFSEDRRLTPFPGLRVSLSCITFVYHLGVPTSSRIVPCPPVVLRPLWLLPRQEALFICPSKEALA